MKKFLIFILLFIVACTGNKVDEAEIKEANQFFESIFLDRVQDSPEFQSRLGYKSNYDQWDDISWNRSKRNAKRAMDDLDYLRSNIDYDLLDDKTKLSYRLMEKSLERRIKSREFTLNNYPVTHRGGKHSSIPSFLINYHQVDDEQDIKDYLGRLRNIEPLMDTLVEELRLRGEIDIVAPKFVYPQAINVAQNIISGFPFEDTKKQNVIYKDFMKKLNSLDLSDPIKTKYTSEVEASLVTIVNSSYR